MMFPYTEEMNENRNDYLYHHGILGQKWGIRRFQNADGSRTSVGKKRYNKSSDKPNSLQWHMKHLERENLEDSDQTIALKRQLRRVKRGKFAVGAATATSTTALGYAAVGSVLFAAPGTVPLMAATGAGAIAGRVAYNHLKDKQRTLERKIVFGD